MNYPLSPNPIDIHTPFTTAERIQQLSQIDKDIASLLRHTSAALRAIASPPPSTSQQSQSQAELPSTEAALANFKSCQTAFLETLDRVDKNLKRQIYALEEAGIITLPRTGDGQAGADGATAGTGAGTAGGAGAPGVGGGAGGQAKEAAARLEPDGMGRYGSLDVGQLNMASNSVERDLETELWVDIRQHTGKVVAERTVKGEQMQD